MKVLENKIPPPVVAALFAAVMWEISIVTSKIRIDETILGIVIAVLLASGVAFAVSAVFTFKQVHTTVNPLKPEMASSLVNSGIYQVSRNPMYVGIALFLLAWGFYLSSVWTFIGVLGFILYMNRFQIEPEERALKENFGIEFESYQSRVRRWL